MKSKKSSFSLVRLAWLLLALFLMAFAWWQVFNARVGLVSRRLLQDGVPLQFLAPQGGQNMPGVLVAHGFGGSRQLMLGYAYVLAQAGYGVMLWDFAGHAANPAPFGRDEVLLQSNLDAAYRALIVQPEIDPARLALLGHSMGSGVVLQAGIRDGGRYAATIAISPTDAPVTAVAPRNLLLQAGAFEPRFVAQANELLARAGGASDDLAAGTARAFVLIPNVEHITILFSPASHQAALDWLNQIFGVQRESDYRDQRIVWYVLHLLGWLLLTTAVAPLLATDEKPTATARRAPWHWLGLMITPFLASALLLLMSRFIDLTTLGGVLVGGALGLWFFIMGGLWLVWGFRPSRLTLAALFWGFFLFALLWMGFGLLAELVWLPWFLLATRLARWPFMALACLPWLLAAGMAQGGAGNGRRFLWWLGQTIFVGGGLLLAIYLIPSLGVLILLLPLLPLLLGLLTLMGQQRLAHPWPYAIGSALFFAWVLLAYFPISG